uniref:Uncharacterized protein n=1 Tax=Romanomermis culicivorax TaxID=13658 RepID=A0A915K6T8_ROMCU
MCIDRSPRSTCLVIESATHENRRRGAVIKTNSMYSLSLANDIYTHGGRKCCRVSSNLENLEKAGKKVVPGKPGKKIKYLNKEDGNQKSEPSFAQKLDGLLNGT